MICVIQRVSSASVTVDKKKVAQIDKGLMILLGIRRADKSEDVDYLVKKISNLRIFEDNAGKMNLSIKDCGGKCLVVSQFTLLADCSRGRRPGFENAAKPDEAVPLYEEFVKKIEACDIETKTGIFGADMLCDIQNDGPITIILDSRAE